MLPILAACGGRVNYLRDVYVHRSLLCAYKRADVATSSAYNFVFETSLLDISFINTSISQCIVVV